MGRQGGREGMCVCMCECVCMYVHVCVCMCVGVAGGQCVGGRWALPAPGGSRLSVTGTGTDGDRRTGTEHPSRLGLRTAGSPLQLPQLRPIRGSHSQSTPTFHSQCSEEAVKLLSMERLNFKE